MMRATRVFIFCLLICSASFSADTAREQGIKAFSEGRYRLALEKLKAASQQSSDTTAHIYLSLTYAALGDCKTALPGLANYAAAEDVRLSKMAGLAAVNCYAAQNDYGHVFSVLQSLEARFPNDADVLYLTAKQHMKAFNDATFAMFQRTPASYRVHELSAEIFEVQNRFPEAVAEYRKAIEVNPSAPELHYRLGRAILLGAHTQEAMQQAKEEFLSELKASPEDAACEFQLGQISLAEGNPAAARPHFDRALSLSPGFVDALVALGKIEVQEKQYPQAISLLKRAVAKEPSNERARYALLTAYRNSGELENAKQEKAILDRLQKPKDGEFTDFLKRLGEKQPEQ
jgi:tetratricopeptide (TPR) repeat protein